jgi:hypothetical protein
MPGRTGICIHRWVLGEPEAAGIQAVCRRCGASRLYPSALQPNEDEPTIFIPVEEPQVSVSELVQELGAARGHALV